MNIQLDNRIVELERQVQHLNTMVAGLCGRLGTLEEALGHVEEVPPRPSTPEVIDLTSDEEEDYVTSSSVIDLSSDTDVEDDVVDLLGGPIEVPVIEVREGSIVPETPPPQEVLELMRETPIDDSGLRAVDWEADLLWRAGEGLPEYEDAPNYVDVPLYKESE